VSPSNRNPVYLKYICVSPEQGEGRQRRQASWKGRDQIQRGFCSAMLSERVENKGTQQKGRSCNKFHQQQ